MTGASQGIGAGLVDAFREAGYAVVGTARSMAPSSETDYATVAGDIAEPATSERVIGAALDRFGRVDTLVNNAGIYVGKPFTDCSIGDFDAITAVNLGGFFHITQRAIRQMVDQGRVTSSTSAAASSTLPTAAGPAR